MVTDSLKRTGVSVLSPLGVDLFCLSRKYLVYNFVSRNLKLKYRRSSLGFLWSLLVPLSTAMMYYFVFQHIARIQVPNYAVFVISALLPWTFFAQTINEGMDSVTLNFRLLTKVPIPIQIFPFTTAATGLINLLLSFPVIILFACLYGIYPGLSYLFLLPLILLLFLIAYSLSLLGSVTFVHFRDLKHLMNVGTQLWMFATPIVYAESMIPQGFRWILYANPVGTLLVSIRHVILENKPPEPLWLLTSLLWTVFFVTLTSYVTKQCQRNLAESL